MLSRLLREPILHFFVIGACLFVAQRYVAPDPRTISISPGLKAELARRLQDLNGRPATPAELADALKKWERDEALFREAQRDHLERDDPGVRAALIDKMHARAAFEIPQREPSDAELTSWLEAHRAQYEMPLRYEFEFLTFGLGEAGAQSERDKAEQQLAAGAEPSTLGRPLSGANLTVSEMAGRIEPELAARIPSLPLGAWQRVETPHSLLIARLKQISGGLPSIAKERPRLAADWASAQRQAAVERVLDRTVARYRFEEKP